MTSTPHGPLAEDVLRRFAAALRADQLYSRGHPIIGRNLEALSAAVQLLHALEPVIVIGIIGEQVIVDDTPITRAESLSAVIRRLKQIGVERISIDAGVTAEEVAVFVDAVATLDAWPDGEPSPFPALPHIRVGRVTLERQVQDASVDMAAFKRLYAEAVSSAESVWDSARTESQPDAVIARSMVDGLAEAVSQNRTALLALTTLKHYDNYTFTHMVNVSILTMGQARALGVDGSLLREFGLAGLMHDIGKVRTPLEILNKPDRLTSDEFTIMRRHTVDGANILRSTPDIPALVPIVAFEHHMRIDGTGYPFGVKRPSLNLGTMLCSIADVYDAMRSQRKYQQSFPSERVLEVLKVDDGSQFDQHLVRRFSQLVGIYPAGNAVRLDTGELAVVVAIFAPEPARPTVRVVVDRLGSRMDVPYDVNLWESEAGDGRPSLVAAPIDSADLGIDPLTLLPT